MRILIINHYAGSPCHGMEFRPFYLAKEWLRKGHQTTIVAASYSHVRHVQPEISRGLTAEVRDGVRYSWLKTPRYAGNGVRRALNILAFAGQLLRYQNQILRDGRPDAVIASSTHPLDTLAAFLLARRCGARLIYEVHDLWPLSPIELGGLARWHPFAILLRIGEMFGYRTADRVVSLLPAAEGHMVDSGMTKGKFRYIPNGVVVEDWAGCADALPDEHASALRLLREAGKFLVCYAGAHGVANDLTTLIEAAGRLRQEQIAFVLVGQGSEKASLMRRSADLGLDNVVFLPPVSRRSIPALLSGMDALFIGLQKKPLFRFGVSPNKLMDYMMAGKPVIQAIDAGNDIVMDASCGISVPAGDPDAIARAVLQLRQSDPESRREMGRRGKAYVERHHSYSHICEEFTRVITDIEIKN